MIEKDGKFLFAKRGIEPQKGIWDLVGGFIEAAETVEDCVLKVISGEPKAQDDVAELQWFSKDSFPEPLAFRNCYAAIERYKAL
ncbi:MAG: NUDIX domain-containing protein [Patescibacteria group bacterium]